VSAQRLFAFALLGHKVRDANAGKTGNQDCSPLWIGNGVSAMKDMQAQVEKLRTHASECTLIRDLGTDPKKRLFIRLADRLSLLAAEAESAVAEETKRKESGC
jgi:hypothetical protein